MSIPPSVGFGTITGVTLRTSDGSPVAGVQFIFTPALQPGLVTVAGSVPPVVIAVDPVVGVTNAAGVLCGPDGVPGVVLTASSDVDVSPSGWTWVVTTPGTSRWPSTAASFVLAPGEVKDLTTITTLSPSLGVEIAAWTAAIAAVTVLRDQAATIATTTATAVATASLALKANIASPTFTGTVSGVSAAMVGLGNVNNTTDAAKPVSTAGQNALNLKADLIAPAIVAAIPAPTFGADLAPALSTWTLAGGASFLSPNLTVPNGGSFSATLAGIVSGATYQVEVTRTGATGSNLIVTLGAATANIPSFLSRLTVVATASGSLLFTVSGFTAVVQAVTVRQVTAFTSSVFTGAFNARAVGNNTAVGNSAQPRITSGVNNNAVGFSAQQFLTVGTNNNAFGADSQQNLTAGFQNNGVGDRSQRSLTTGGNNNAVGGNAQEFLTTGLSNAAFGHQAQRALTTGSNNVGVGTNAQLNLTTGANNNAVGANAQFGLLTGSANSAFGQGAQFSLTGGDNNNAVGNDAQFNITDGSNNNGIGRLAQNLLTTGSNNNAVGFHAQRSPLGNSAFATTTGGNQVSVGHETGQNTATQLAEITTIGHRATAGANKGTALGAFSRADHADSVALGSDTTTTFASQVMVGGRDLEITTATTRGIILRSPDGTRYRIAVANGGTLTVTAV